MKLPNSIKDKLCAALGLGLVCGLALPLESAQAKSKKDKPSDVTKKQEPSKDEPAVDGKTGSAKPNKAEEPKQAKDPCPACGRG